MKSGIYCIEHVESGKKYVGSAVRLHARLRRHRYELRHNKHASNHLQAAWNKYGELAFDIRVLLICAKENLLVYEQRCIDGYDAVDNGYNKRRLATSNLGVVVSAETRAKLSAAGKGRRCPPETREKISAAQRGRTFSIERRQKLRDAHLGKRWSAAQYASRGYACPQL